MRTGCCRSRGVGWGWSRRLGLSARTTRRSRTVVFSTEKVATRNIDSCRSNKSQCKGWHVDRRKWAGQTLTVMKGQGADGSAISKGPNLRNLLQAPSSASEKGQTKHSLLPQERVQILSDTQKVLACESEIEGPVRRLSWELLLLQRERTTQVRNKMSSAHNLARTSTASLGSRRGASLPHVYIIVARGPEGGGTSTLSAESKENTNKGPMTTAQPTNLLYFRVSPSGQYCN